MLYCNDSPKALFYIHFEKVELANDYYYSKAK